MDEVKRVCAIQCNTITRNGSRRLVPSFLLNMSEATKLAVPPSILDTDLYKVLYLYLIASLVTSRNYEMAR